MLNAFFKDESGATAIEYGLIAGLIFLAIVGAVSAMMNGADGMYTIIGREIGGTLSQ